MEAAEEPPAPPPAPPSNPILSSIERNADRTAFAWREAPVSASSAAVLTEKELKQQFSTLSYRDFGAQARVVARRLAAFPVGKLPAN